MSGPDRERTRHRGRVLAAVLASVVVIVISGVVGWKIGTNREADLVAAGPKIPASVPVVVFLGDSYSSGTGASSIGTRWSTLVSASLGWSEINASSPGMGYTTNYQGQATNYDTKVDVVAAAQPDIVVISGGRNDFGAGTSTMVSTAAESLYDVVKASAPEAEILVISPIWDSTTPPPDFSAMVDAVRQSTESAGTEYLDIGEPLGNHPEMIDSDGLHPNDLGHRAIAERVVDAVISRDTQ